MLQAIIFDFNGVILNDEPVHFAAMRETVASVGVDLKEEQYWGKYLPLDDARCLDAILRDHAIPLKRGKRQKMLLRKSQTYQRLSPAKLQLFPGVVEFIQAAALSSPLALASGAQRSEIESTLESEGLRRYFLVIAAAEDFSRGKPHPESFLFVLKQLNDSLGSDPIRPEGCLVIEDSFGGIQGAKDAGMKCMAVTNSYPRRMLGAADLVVNSLKEVRVDDLKRLFGESL
jgi:beta-phosphoglucomutase